MRALWAIDAAMQAIVVSARDPMIARIKLAWWREQLEGIAGGPVPAEPRLQAAADELLPRGVSGGDIAALEMGWSTLLDDEPDFGAVMIRGGILFQMGGRLLGTEDRFLDSAGILYALNSAARLGRRPPDDLIMPVWTPLRGHVMPWRLRSMTALARLAVRDLRRRAPFEPEGTRSRAFQILLHLWFGRVA
jgi:phytoene synthase